MLKKILLISGLFLLPSVNAGTWTEWGKVTQLQTFANNSFRFKTSAPFVANQVGAEPCDSG